MASFHASRACARANGRPVTSPSVHIRGYQGRLPVVARAATAAPPSEALATRPQTSAEYAVIHTPTGQQLVEEGKWFALCNQTAAQMTRETGGKTLRFTPSSVKTADGEFVRGKPLLSDWVVEAELVDERAFAVHAATLEEGRALLGKVVVTKIVHTEQTRKLLEDAFLA